MGKYDDLSKEQLTNLLVKRDAQARLGLVWERDEIQRDCALNDKFVAMDLVSDECRGQGPWRNLVIGGENFDALRWLRMTMAGRARLIYLDPPYNTGNKDWVYNDKYVTKTDQYRHSTWLEWMHVRLELARDLLAPDGAIFASIDDNEGAHLRLLMDQVFGPDRFVASFIWQKVDSPNDNKPVIAADHEFIHCYASKATVARWQKMPDAGVLNGFSMRDEQDRLYRDRILRKNGKSSLRTDRETMWFALDAPDGTKVWPIRDDGLEGRWSHGKDGVKRLQREGRFIWKQVTRPDGTLSWMPYSNGMEAVRTIRADRRVEGVDPGIARCTGQITVRFENTTLLAQAQAGTSAEFAMAFTIDANRSLTITLHEVYLALAKTPIEGPAGVEASFDFRAAFNATATRMMTAVLRNQQAGTEYA